MTREFELVLFGATGFTGRLVADYLSMSPEKPRWAIAGRNKAKLEALGLDVPILVADALDPSSLAAVAQRTRVVCTTVGPYAKYGSDLVAACATAGTHYCDLAGEVQWMRRMIDAHHERARETGARIVHACGFDSIPSDLGTWALQQEMIATFGAPASSVTALFGESSGRASGGTVASGAQTAIEAGADRAVREVLSNPYALDPDPYASRPPVRDEASIGWDARLKMFTVPFLMAQINTRVVRRAHALAGFPWGQDFTYREVMSTPGSPRGLVKATGITAALAGLAFALKRPRLRAQLLARAPKPGEGPTAEQRARGYWKVRFIGENGPHRLVYIVADAHGDPGYQSTAKMLGEAALSLARDPLTSSGGVITPSVAMGGALLQRLRRAGLTFEVAG
ncbi:MAG: saccharopine dehydrogenase NADP-binding domain-containing protein [Kofleriaceae bacterium]|nr:saccharopine dehydrogenase NADP-binding domain-containing protein [Kofleriaceae bacterium]